MHRTGEQGYRFPEKRDAGVRRRRGSERPRFGAMFYVLFVSMLAVLTIPIVVSFYVQGQSDALLREELIRTETSLMGTTRMVSDRAVLSVRQYASRMAENEEVQAFLSTPRVQTAEERMLVKHAFDAIHVETDRPDCITDIYLLSLQNRYIISATAGSNADGSPLFDYEVHFGCDGETLWELLGKRHASLLFIPEEKTAAQRMYYLRVVTAKSSASPQGYVLFCYRFPEEALPAEQEAYCALAPAEKLLWDMRNGGFLPEEESELLAGVDSSGFVTINGSEYLVTRQHSEVLRADYLRAVRSDSLFQAQRNAQRFERLCLIGCMLVCAALSLILSRRNYSPVLQLVKNLQQSENRKALSDANFRWIEEKYHGLLESHTQLTGQLEQEKHLIVNNLFCRLLKGYYRSEYEIENVFGPRLIVFREARFRLILWSADDEMQPPETAAAGTPDSVDLLQYILAGIAREYMKPLAEAVWSVECDGMIYILCNYAARENRSEADFTRANMEIKGILKERAGVSFSWFLSGEYSSATELSLAYMECIEHMRQWNMPDPREEALAVKAAESRLLTEAERDRVYARLNAGQAREARRIFEEMMAGFEREHPAEFSRRLFLYAFLSGLNEYAQEVEMEIPSEVEAALAPLEGAGDAETLKREIAEMLEAWTEKNKNGVGPETGNLPEEIMRYVNAHLADPDLSLTKIANQFGLSESYLSRLIRKTFDIQLMTYVNAKRTERVAELLEHTSKTLNEIAAVAGFSSYRTMIRVFEQYHMMTPSQYRREKRAERKGHTQEGVGAD